MIDSNFGSITIASLMCGAASEYPQAFLNIDREEEKKSIIENSLNKLISTIKILNPSSCFIAGGTYFIPGKFYKLNSLIAQPSFDQIQNKAFKHELSLNIFNLEGGKSVSVSNSDNTLYSVNSEILPICDILSQSIESHKYDLYDF